MFIPGFMMHSSVCVQCRQFLRFNFYFIKRERGNIPVCDPPHVAPMRELTWLFPKAFFVVLRLFGRSDDTRFLFHPVRRGRKHPEALFLLLRYRRERSAVRR